MLTVPFAEVCLRGRCLQRHGSKQNNREAKEAMCKHNWLIETPDGSFSIGRCRGCGDVREFPNYCLIGKGSYLSTSPPMGKPIPKPKQTQMSVAARD